METINCFKCGTAIPAENSRKYKGERYCHKCYKSFKKERELAGLAAFR